MTPLEQDQRPDELHTVTGDDNIDLAALCSIKREEISSRMRELIEELERAAEKASAK